MSSMKYDLFADRCESGEPQQFASVELLHQEDDQMIEEIVECLNEYNFRDCVISWTATTKCEVF